VNLLRRVDTYWFAPMPAERLAALRVITGGFAVLYLLTRSAHLTGYAHFPERDFSPIGVAAWSSAPLPPWATYAIFALTLAAGLAFVSGAYYRASAPLFAAGFLWITTYRSSWGMIFHQDNLVALHLSVLALAPAHAVWAYDARSPRPAPPFRDGRFGWAVRSMCWLTVVSYVLAGIAKVENAGWEWSAGEILRTHVAYDAVRKLELGGIHSPIGAWIVQFEWPFQILGVLTLVLELGAPMALLHRRLAAAWVVGVWGFHLGVVALMAITFAYPVSGAAFASFFAVERLSELPKVRRLLTWLGRRFNKP
jgi:hypothetical protein